MWRFYPSAFQAKGVLSLPPSVRPWTLPCPHDNFSQIWAGITKFVPNMHHGILSAGIGNRGHWPWPSRSFWPFWLRILGNSVCPCHNLQWIWVRITKFAPNMHLEILLTGIEYGDHWPWPSRSLGRFISRFQETASNITLVHHTDLGWPRGVTPIPMAIWGPSQ